MTVPNPLRFVLGWIDECDGEPYDTLANIRVDVHGQPIWPVWGDASSDLDVFADDLLSFLTENWRKLLLEQHYPQRVQPGVPSQLSATVEEMAEGQPRVTAEALFAAVGAFEASHDLARSIGGQFELPALWMLRQGDDMLIEANGRTLRLDVATWCSAAGVFGDAIAARLTARRPEKYERLVAAWQARDTGDPLHMLSISIGQSREVSRELVLAGLLKAEPSVSRVANDNDVLRIAARMVGAAPTLQIKRILTTIAATPAVTASGLDAAALAVREAVAMLPASSAAHEEGVQAARRLREWLDISPERSADPFAVLVQMGVPLSNQSLELPTLDALAVWGDSHGPAVVVNSDSKRYQGAPDQRLTGPAARATVAHEICHLLLDRGRALAAVDIMNGRMPPAMEKRAGAFAAEFLLPAATAATIWRRSKFATDLAGVTAILARLANRFSISRQMAAWQLDHGLLSTEPEVLFWLDVLYPQRRERGGRR